MEGIFDNFRKEVRKKSRRTSQENKAKKEENATKWGERLGDFFVEGSNVHIHRSVAEISRNAPK